MIDRRGLFGAAALPFVAPALVRSGGRIERFEGPDPVGILPRPVDVWLPPGYDGGTGRYPVLYMQDGQNVFEPGRAYGGQEWRIDETLDRLIAEGRVRAPIVVGVWNTSDRSLDYMPEKAVKAETFTLGFGSDEMRAEDFKSHTPASNH